MKTPHLLALLLLALPAHADQFQLAGGKTYFQQDTKDNYWFQEMFPYRHDADATAWRIAYVAPMDGKWSGSAGWVNLGSNSVHGFGVPDEDYDDKANKCHKCEHVAELNTTSWAYGPEIGFVYDATESLYLRTGLFMWATRLESRIKWVKGYTGSFVYTERSFLLAPYLGLGVNRGPFFADVTYYHGLGGGGYPLAKKAIVPMLGIRKEF